MPRRKLVPPIGSISSGTLRTEDLLYAFSYYCRDYGGKDGRRLNREYGIMKAWDDMTAEEQEEAGYLLEEMTECLQNAAPDYVDFGAHEGDGADFGFWPSMDALADAMRGTNPEVLKVDDTSEIPADYRGHVLHVNDHGNVTLYMRTARRLFELWSVV